MVDSEQSRSDEPAYRSWKVVREDGHEEAEYAGRTRDDELLGKLLAMWSHDIRMDDWHDRLRFAGLCYQESTLTLREAAGMTGLEPSEVRKISISDGSPWELDNPRRPGYVHVVREVGLPDSIEESQ